MNMSPENDRIFTGEPMPEPSELDVPTIHELRFRVAGLIMTEQISLAHSKGLEVVEPQSDAELVAAVSQMENYLKHELPAVKRERAAYRRALWEVMDSIDDMEEKALRTKDD